MKLCVATSCIFGKRFSTYQVADFSYEKMEAILPSRAKPSVDVHVILRVVNLGQDSIGLHNYVDPATMERKGKSVFEPDAYFVILLSH